MLKCRQYQRCRLRSIQARSARAGARPLGSGYRVATLDDDAPEIFDGLLAFVQKHSIGKQNG